MDKQTDRRD